MSAANAVAVKSSTLSATGAMSLEALVSNTMALSAPSIPVSASASSSSSNVVQLQQQHVLQSHHQQQGSGGGASIGKAVNTSGAVQPSAAVPVAGPMPNGPTSALLASSAGGDASAGSAVGSSALLATSEPLQMSDVEKAVAGRGWPSAVDALFSAEHDPRFSPLIGKLMSVGVY